MHRTGRGVLGNKAGLGHGDHPGARRGAPAHRQVDRLHVGRLGLPDRRARGDDPARGAVRGVPHRARDPDRQARGRARDRAAVRRRAGQLRAHAEPARLLARAAAAELPLAASARPGTKVHGVGKIGDIFAGCDIDESFPTKSNVDGINRTDGAAARSSTSGLVFVNLVETDMLWGHRNDPVNFHRCLQDFDRRLRRHPRRAARRRPPDPHLRPRLRPDDAVDRPLARARAPARLRAGPERERARARGRVRRRRRDRERLARRQAAAAAASRARRSLVADDPARRADRAQAERGGASGATRSPSWSSATRAARSPTTSWPRSAWPSTSAA